MAARGLSLNSVSFVLFENYLLTWFCLYLFALRYGAFSTYVFYVGASAIRVFANPDPAWTPAWQALLDSSAAQTFAIFIFVVEAARRVPWETFRALAPWIVALNWAMIAAWPHAGILMTVTMSSCLSAVLLPFCNRWFWLAHFVVCYATGKNTPIACALAAALVLRPRLAWLALPAAVIAFYHGHGEWHDVGGRLNAWLATASFWTARGHWLVGEGLGSFAVLGPEITHSDKNGLFIWLHSDWLQGLFEGGILMVLAMAFCFARAIRYVRFENSRQTAASLTAYGLWATVQMPLHFLLSALLGGVLIRRAYSFGEAPKVSTLNFLAALREHRRQREPLF